VAAPFTGCTCDVRIPCALVMVRAGIPSSVSVLCHTIPLGTTKWLPPCDPIRAAERLTTTVAVVVAMDMLATSIQAIVRWADARSVHPVCPWNLITLNLRGGYMLLILIPH
jgi:hypothetical protein